ncbi:Ku protein, partial [Bacillus cereus]|nr:Ku protein [Bacillus cereus]
KEKELTMAKMLIEQLSTPFDAAKYTDQYRERLLDLIQHKVAGEEVRIAPTQPQTNVVDLMAALQASIEAVQPVVTDPGPAAKKRPARKPAAPTAQQAVAGEPISPPPVKKKSSTAKRKET